MGFVHHQLSTNYTRLLFKNILRDLIKIFILYILILFILDTLIPVIIPVALKNPSHYDD